MVPGLDPPPMHDFGTAVVDKTIYFMGGKNTLGIPLKTVVSLDLENTQEGWKTMPQMKVARKSPSATVAQGKIYVFGGSVDVPLSTIVLASCEVYDPNTKRWKHISDMGQKRESAAVAVHNGKIFVTGGFDGEHRLDSAEMFDTFTNQWAPLPNMSHARMNHVSVIHQGKLYVSRGSRVPYDRRSGVLVNGEWIDPIWDELDLDNINKGWGKSWTRLAPSRRLAPPEAHTVEVTGVHRPSFQPGGGILVQRGVGVGFLAASQLISRPIFLRIHNTIMNRNSPTGNPSLVDMCSDL